MRRGKEQKLGNIFDGLNPTGKWTKIAKTLLLGAKPTHNTPNMKQQLPEFARKNKLFQVK